MQETDSQVQETGSQHKPKTGNSSNWKPRLRTIAIAVVLAIVILKFWPDQQNQYTGTKTWPPSHKTYLEQSWIDKATVTIKGSRSDNGITLWKPVSITAGSDSVVSIKFVEQAQEHNRPEVAIEIWLQLPPDSSAWQKVDLRPVSGGRTVRLATLKAGEAIISRREGSKTQWLDPTDRNFVGTLEVLSARQKTLLVSLRLVAPKIGVDINSSFPLTRKNVSVD